MQDLRKPTFLLRLKVEKEISEQLYTLSEIKVGGVR